MAKRRPLGGPSSVPPSYSKTGLFRNANRASGNQAATKSKGGTSDSERRRARVGAARSANKRTRAANAAGARATLQASRGFN